ncbi:MAG: T9SS type A sorting domain-containing protein, partial [Hymenobacter sp.]
FLRLADIDNDGDLDIVTSFPSALSVQRNNGAGIFTAPAPLLVPNIYVEQFALTDVDGDGDLDFVGSTLLQNTPAGDVWLNNGQGVFTPNGVMSHQYKFTGAMGDLDGDGDLDALNGGARYNDGHGNFYGAAATTIDARGSALVDLDNDGDLDAISSSGTGNAYFTNLNDGTGALGPSTFMPGNYTDNLLVRDLNGDGYADIVTPGYYQPSLLLNTGQGTFAAGTAIAAYGLPLALGDVDGDGDADLITAQGCYLNNGQAVFQQLPSPGAAYAGNVFGALGDLDSDGDLDLVTAFSMTSPGVSAGWNIRFNRNQTSLATAAPTATGIQVWPNPVVNGRLHVSRPAGAGNLRLCTALGQTVWQQPAGDKAEDWQLPPLASGLYLLLIQTADQPTTMQRIVVE